MKAEQPVRTLTAGDTFGTRRGNRYTVLEIEQATDNDGRGIQDDNGNPKMRLLVRDLQLDIEYLAHYMGSDLVLRADKPAKQKKA